MNYPKIIRFLTKKTHWNRMEQVTQQLCSPQAKTLRPQSYLLFFSRELKIYKKLSSLMAITVFKDDSLSPTKQDLCVPKATALNFNPFWTRWLNFSAWNICCIKNLEVYNLYILNMKCSFRLLWNLHKPYKYQFENVRKFNKLVILGWTFNHLY